MGKQKSTGFSDFERSAMVERAKELQIEARSKNKKALGEKAVLVAIEKMPEPDRTMAKTLHDLVKKHAPALSPKTWYGMPAYAIHDKVVCFYQSAGKFKTRYASLGFNDPAKLDDGSMWPVAYALKKLSPVEATKIAALLKKAVR